MSVKTLYFIPIDNMKKYRVNYVKIVNFNGEQTYILLPFQDHICGSIAPSAYPPRLYREIVMSVI